MRILIITQNEPFFLAENLRYLITDTNGKILKNSDNLSSLLKNTNWKKLSD